MDIDLEALIKMHVLDCNTDALDRLATVHPDQEVREMAGAKLVSVLIVQGATNKLRLVGTSSEYVKSVSICAQGIAAIMEIINDHPTLAFLLANQLPPSTSKSLIIGILKNRK